jgi:Ca2+/H+ antiporter, TMEM165/GDT1 family
VPILQWLLAGVPAFAASLVEFVEALTIVLAVGASRGWRAALGGAAAAVAVLLALVALFGPSLLRVPQQPLQLVVGTLLLLFGIRWLRKACLRSAGVIPLHDELRAFARVRDGLSADAAPRLDWTAAAASFNGVLLEGIEVVFIVLALGSSARALGPAIVGASAGFVAVALLGVAVHRPLARVPENALKTGVGVMLASFGTLWIGEGLQITWPGGDGAVVALMAVYLATAFGAAAVARRS